MNYTPTHFNTAEDKEWFVKHFIRFAEKGFPQHLFTKKFYRKLINTFGHIAHYDINGFWETFFTNTPDKVDFLEQTMNFPCYGNPAYTYCDAEKEIQRQLAEKHILESLKGVEMQELHNAEYNEYQRLKKKFEIA